MYPIWVLLVISGIIPSRVSALWVTVEDFSRSELANLTPPEEHALMLQKLAKNEKGILACSFYYEILSISIGNNFFGFVHDTNAAQECNAIIKATLECFKNLQIQDRIEVLLLRVSQNGADYVPITGGFPLAFPLTCSDIDFYLGNETLYTTLRNKYKREKYLPPTKTYHYGIAKSGDEEIKAMEELLNEPKMRPLMAHLAWVWTLYSKNSKLKDIKNTVTALAKVPELSKKVQNIYEKSIDEVTPLVKRVDSLIDVDGARKVYFNYLQPNLTERLWSNIIHEIPDWFDYLECDQTSDADLDLSQSPTKPLRSDHCGKSRITEGSIFIQAWPVTSDFSASELEHLTQQQEHDLFLTKLANKNSTLIQKFMYLELLAKTIGNDFFGFTKDETDNARNNAIVKAAFECISNLKLQSRVLDALSSAIKNNVAFVRTTGDISTGFSRICSNMDDMLKSETVYTTQRDKHLKQNVRSPKKIYQYGVGNPTEDQIKIIANLLNDPSLRNYWAHSVWAIKNSGPSESNEQKTKSSILELAKVPSKSEAVQKLYDQSIREIVPLIQNFTYNRILENLNSPDARVISYDEADLALHKSFLLKLMVSKIKKYPDLVAIYNAFLYKGA